MLGLSFTDSEVRAVLAGGSLLKGYIRSSFTEKLPKGAIQKGVVTNIDAVGGVLRTIRAAKHASRVAICLPSEKVYCVNFILPAGQAHTQDVMRESIAHMIPEDISQLHYFVRTLKKEKKGTRMGVVAVRKDLLNGYIEACEKAGTTVASVTTLPFILGSHGGSTAVVCMNPSMQPVLTLMDEGWPLDEAVLPKNISDKDIASELKDLLKEYRNDYVMNSVRIAAPASVATAIQNLLPDMHCTHLLSWVQDDNASHMGSIAAAVAGHAGFPLVQHRQTAITVAVVAFVAVALCGAMLTYVGPEWVASLLP